jgi:molecular chaperone GrpE
MEPAMNVQPVRASETAPATIRIAHSVPQVGRAQRVIHRAECATSGGRAAAIRYAVAMADPEFDAVAAAKELDDLLGSDTSSTGSASDDYVAGLEDEIEALNQALAKKDAELVKANARADAAHAEIAAVGKRLASSSAKELEQRTHKILESFLSTVDDLDRALAASPAGGREGIALVRRSMLTRFSQLVVTHAPARGEVFDPNRHEAIALVPVRDPKQDGRVIDVMREGYLIGDKTLRPAAVAVGKLSR